jgi:hypothetical protein
LNCSSSSFSCTFLMGYSRTKLKSGGMLKHLILAHCKLSLHYINVYLFEFCLSCCHEWMNIHCN